MYLYFYIVFITIVHLYNTTIFFFIMCYCAAQPAITRCVICIMYIVWIICMYYKQFIFINKDVSRGVVFFTQSLLCCQLNRKKNYIISLSMYYISIHNMYIKIYIIYFYSLAFHIFTLLTLIWLGNGPNAMVLKRVKWASTTV